MKKFFYAVIILALLAGSFWAGSWYTRREATKNIPPGIKSFQPSPGNRTDAGSDTNVDTSSLPPGTVKISPGKEQTIGIRLGVVEKISAHHTLRILGRVAADETRIYRINAAVDGWITETPPNTVGSLVKKDETLASFYSPEFLGAQQAYLYALGAMDRFQATGKETPSQIDLTKANIQQYKDSLKNQGMSDLQIEEIAKTRQYTQKIHIVSPASGFILVRNVSPGERFEKGKELYRISDLSRVWVLADIFENEGQYFQPGKIVKASLPYQKKTFQAKVSNVLPQFDPATRTLKVRMEAENPDYLMRPDMFVDVELPIQLSPALTVPADAILDSGLKKTVFVDRGNGLFEPREVETGWRMGNRVEIVKGLEPGERIVISGNFLIDSESKLDMAASGMKGALSKDPVCGQEISPVKAEKAGRKIGYGGKTYYFDTDECKQQFEKDPKRYVAKPTEGDSPAPQVPSPKASKKANGHEH